MVPFVVQAICTRVVLLKRHYFGRFVLPICAQVYTVPVVFQSQEVGQFANVQVRREDAQVEGGFFDVFMFVRRFYNFVPVRHVYVSVRRVRFLRCFQCSRVDARTSVVFSFYAAFNDGRCRAVYAAQSVSDYNENVFRSLGEFSVQQVGYQGQVNYLRRAIFTYSQRSAANGEGAVRSVGQFNENKR